MAARQQFSDSTGGKESRTIQVGGEG